MILNELTMSDALRRWHRRRLAPSLMALAVDIIVVVLAIYLAWQLRNTLSWFPDARDVNVIAQTAIAPMALLWIGILALSSAYLPTGMGAGTSEYRRVVLASAITAGSIGVLCYLLRFPLSRGLFFLTFVVGVPLLLLGRNIVRRTVHRLHERQILTQKVLLVGGSQQVAEVAKVLRRERWLGYEIVGAAIPGDELSRETIGGVPILGSSERIKSLAHEWAPDIVMFAGGAVNSAAEMRRAAWGLESSGARIMIVPSLTDVASDRITVRPAAGLPMMELEGPASHVRAHVLKRTFDVVGGGLLLVLFSPLLAVTALAIKRHDGGPVLYRQVIRMASRSAA